jgi:hypothetical protein
MGRCGYGLEGSCFTDVMLTDYLHSSISYHQKHALRTAIPATYERLNRVRCRKRTFPRSFQSVSGITACLLVVMVVV